MPSACGDVSSASFGAPQSADHTVPPPLLPCRSLSFLVKLEQLDLGGNDLEVLVREGCCVGKAMAGRWKGRRAGYIWNPFASACFVEGGRLL